MKKFVVAVSALLFTACSVPLQASLTSNQVVKDKPVSSEAPALPPGSNEMLRAPIKLADGLEVIISDVIIPPNKTVPRHYHPGEEFVYIIEGSVVHVEAGKPEFILKAGDAVTIAPEVEHAPRGTKEGARAVVFRVHPKGTSERTLVEKQ
jgi:quercetin dioxygenase-like cupin family protein